MNPVAKPPAFPAFLAIAFDLDGVLLDSEPAHFAAEVELLGRYGVEFAEDVWQSMKGLTDLQLFERLRGLGLAPPVPDVQLIGEKLELLLRILPDRARPFPGAVATVRALSGRALALVTSSSLPLTVLSLQILGLEDAFPVRVTGDDVRRGKPDPEPFAVAASRLGIEPAGCLAVEDSIHGVESAVRAGMTCVAVEHSFPAERLRRAHRVVPVVADVPAALAALERGGEIRGPLPAAE